MGDYTTHTTLLQRVSSGADPEAWQEFCSRYGELIRGFARRRYLQPADCDEVLQDVLTSLTQALPRFRYDPAVGKFRSYLKTIALRAIFRRLRQKRGESPLDELGEATPVNDAATEELWEEEWRQYHLRQAMQKIQDEFNPADRAAFDAYALRGRDAQETARSLGMSVDQIYQAKSRILKRLSQIIEESIREEG